MANRILLVDDDAVSLALLAILFEGEDMETAQAQDGHDALLRLNGPGQFYAVLADLGMPGLAGAALAAEIRKLLSHVPLLIAMSASVQQLPEGYDAFVTKPVDAEAIRLILSSHTAGEPVGAETWNALRRMQRIMPASAVAEIYEVFLRDTRARARQMLAVYPGIADGGERVRSSAHAIKGSAGMIGALPICALATRLESGQVSTAELAIVVGEILRACDDLEGMLGAKGTDDHTGEAE